MTKFNAAFWKWFGDSKVVDAKGRPLAVYHGSSVKRTEFRRDRDVELAGAFFTSDKAVARDYAEMDADDGGRPYVISAYLSLQNPYFTTDGNEFQVLSHERRDELEAQGHDGLIGEYPDGTREFVAFRPTQIKSATGNRGTWDASDPDIRHNPDEISITQAVELVVKTTLARGWRIDPPEKSPQSQSVYVWVYPPNREMQQLRISDHELPSLRAQGRIPRGHIFVKDWAGRPLSKEDVLEQIDEALDWWSRANPPAPRLPITKAEVGWLEWAADPIGEALSAADSSEELYGEDLSARAQELTPRVVGNFAILPTHREVLEDLLYRLEDQAEAVAECDAVSEAQIANRCAKAKTLARKIRDWMEANGL